MTTYLYARTSTEARENGIDAQLALLRRWASGKADIEEVIEHGSGKSIGGRPKFTELLSRLGPGDYLVSTTISRFSRSVVDFASLIERSQAAGWTLVVTDMDLDTSTATGRFCAGVMIQFAQFERELISERTKAALAVLKSKGIKLGRPAMRTPETADLIRSLRQTMTLVEVADKLNADGIPTPSGQGKWHGSMVRRYEEV